MGEILDRIVREVLFENALLKEGKELAIHIYMQISGGMLFQTETTVNARALERFWNRVNNVKRI